MKRTEAREIAIRLAYSLKITSEMPEDVFEQFFEEEYYKTLKTEDETFENLPDKKQMEYIKRLVTLCYEHDVELKHYLTTYAKGWKPERISATASAILRCAMCEILYMDDIPNAAAINEAVQLAKYYDDADVVSFVNGVLGGFIRGELGEKIEEILVEETEVLEDEVLEETMETETV